MNKITSVRITRTPYRLNNTSDNIRSREIYLLIVDVVVGGGDVDSDEVGDDGARSRLSISGGRTSLLKMPRAGQR
jgi:hypothetical protein